jgi:DNA-binding response OmpR family regulator
MRSRREAGAATITKPFDKTEILAVIDKILTIKDLQEVRTPRAQLKIDMASKSW